jgi:hypothetical protein
MLLCSSIFSRTSGSEVESSGCPCSVSRARFIHQTTAIRSFRVTNATGS